MVFMIYERRQFLIFLAALAVMPVASSSLQADDDDKRRIRTGDRHSNRDAAAEALQRGDIRPLAEVIEEVRKHHRGEIVGVEFERKHGKWVYEFKMIRPDQRFIEIYVDARTKEIIKVEGD